MDIKNNLSDTEVAIFRDSVGDVKRLQSDIVAQPAPRPAAYPHQTRSDEARVMEEALHADFPLEDIQPGEMLSFARPGVQKTVIRKLKRGQYRVAAELDLHGMSAGAASWALNEFIQQARSVRAGCVRIIHGKGRRSSNQGPVIKPLVNRLLRQRDEVLAFCSARPVDGGTGAVYVLLKRR